jgi:GTP-binding protein Era
MTQTPQRTGQVAIVGRPNVGKSTLINALVGYKVSIVSPKAQTTRHRILGIGTRAEGQVVYVDTPGLHSGGKRAINRYMNRAARGSLVDVQLVALVIEAGQWRDEDHHAYEAVVESGVQRVLIINKVDRIKDKAELLPFIGKVTEGRGFDAVFPVSAEKKVGLDDLERGLIAMLPEGEPAFAEDEVTDRSERFLVSELIREQLMRQLGDELPYSAAVEIEEWSDEPKITKISAVVWVERDGQKAIVIGAGGGRMRSIGTSARIAIEEQLGRKVFLQMWCKVREDWSDNETSLRKFGYTE